MDNPTGCSTVLWSLLLLLFPGEADLAFIGLEVNHINFLDFDVEVTEPLVNVAAVLGLNIFEGINFIIDCAIYQGNFELASIDFKFTIDDREGTPSYCDVFRAALIGQVNQLKDHHITRHKVDLRREHEVYLMLSEVEFTIFVFLVVGVEELDLCMLLSEIYPDLLNIVFTLQVLNVVPFVEDFTLEFI